MKKHFPPRQKLCNAPGATSRCGFCGPTLMSWARPTTTGSTTSWTKSDTGSGSARRCWSGGRCPTGQTRKSSKSCGSSFPASTAGRRNPRASSTPTGARQSSAPIPCSWTSGPHARPGTGRRFAARMLRATSQTAIRGGIFTRLWNASPKGWRPLSPKLPNWERKST